MSVLDYMFDSEWLQRSDIENLKRNSSAMRQIATRESGRIRNLEEEIDHLTLINEALLRMLEKKGVILRDEFRALLVEVDLEDGVHDGKLAKPAPARAAAGSRCRSCRTENDPANKFCSGCRRPLFRR
jgi:hypothetical protein